MKNHTILTEKLSQEKQITTKDIINLGFSHYDINLFIKNNILTKVSRGLYYYRPPLTINEEPISVIEDKTTIVEEPKPIISEDKIKQLNYNASNFMMKRELDKAISLYEEIIEIDKTNQYARLGIFACYMFKKEFNNAYQKLIELYENRNNNELLINIYNYLLLLKEITPIDEKCLNDIANIIATDNSNIKRPREHSFIDKLTKAIKYGDWENALKYSNIIISVDKNQRKYRITNQCYRFLVIAVVKNKNLVFERREPEKIEPIEYEEETVIVVPKTEIEQTIKQNILLEAINNNDYQKALNILEEEQIDNPLEVIKTLLTKLHQIQSLITTSTPIKVTSTEEVRIVEEVPTLEQPIAEEIKDNKEEKVIQEQPESNINFLINTSYRAYKDSLREDNFKEAHRNLQRYEYLKNQNNTHRNIKYHYNRIEILEKDYNANPEKYFLKKQLYSSIIQAKYNKSYEEVLYLIDEYKKIGGLIHPTIPIIEVEIYILLNDFEKAKILLNNITENEEPSYFKAKAHILYEQRNYEECIKMCIEYNDRRPNQSASNYIMLAKCYQRLYKPSKAIKALRKADEINKERNFTKDLSKEIAYLEIQSEHQKEQRLTKSPKKNKK